MHFPLHLQMHMRRQRRPVLCLFGEGWFDFGSGSYGGLCRHYFSVNVVSDSIVMPVCLDWGVSTFRAASVSLQGACDVCVCSTSGPLSGLMSLTRLRARGQQGFLDTA